eukprot:MONOS_14985.1-p1 / transcript=MONOS_14985.1 / gene=MONOS_14985 / organism=Monocercomonoides_exilis_PA203 / gene_product=unspecified product / transcript_product=unspecified product / location=Mono_scaffold01120:4915-5803(+) / protein_length=270 / sequence_SO=supercontig / SO=protein_coding / is_pseudo=false
MSVKELGCVFAGKAFEKIFEMVEGEKLVLEDGIMLLKHVGYFKALSDIHTDNDGESSFRKRFERRVMNEEWKKGPKKEKMLNDVCECYALSYEQFVTFNFSLVCVPRLLGVASNKGDSQDAQKEVETALLALSHIGEDEYVEEDVFMSSIVSVIVRHQQNSNLTQLAYQSAWQFLMNRMHTKAQMESAMSMHFGFVEEGRRELAEKGKEGERAEIHSHDSEMAENTQQAFCEPSAIEREKHKIGSSGCWDLQKGEGLFWRTVFGMPGAA